MDVILLTQRRLLIGVFALTTIGFFDYTFRLPRLILVLTAVLLLAVLPAWFVVLRRWVRTTKDRTIIISDTNENVRMILRLVDVPVIGYVSPSEPPVSSNDEGAATAAYPDGGQAIVADPLTDLEHLGGLSRLENVFIEHDVDTAILAFTQSRSQEFFGVLDTCYRHGVTAKVHRDHASDVLTGGTLSAGELLKVDLSPLDWQDQAVKRVFDVSFAATGLLVLSPFILLIALCVKLDSPGPVFYGQRRTAEFGDTFRVYKFRTMLPNSESTTPVDDEENDRITRVGRILRKTHLDEIPQLWSILTGKMSVVGPRAVWTDEEEEIEQETEEWRKRWFVKPGLTGLAQIHDVSSTQPTAKLRYDLEYIKRQSFWFDLKIVFRQIWKIVREFM
ncbi:sugar transferase [Halegenticoccus soli]|uniref:sugar transferase n=1 Tax=Halegenticoccus soli TaxID=1985678 RepID=UPI001E629A6B|nr:sugar transferase [Halegenticoccus soli]